MVYGDQPPPSPVHSFTTTTPTPKPPTNQHHQTPSRHPTQTKTTTSPGGAARAVPPRVPAHGLRLRRRHRPRLPLHSLRVSAVRSWLVGWLVGTSGWCLLVLLGSVGVRKVEGGGRRVVSFPHPPQPPIPISTTVNSDLMQNPLIVPVKILRGHTITKEIGVMSLCWHPTQPWLFSCGADGKVILHQDLY
jgi:hypothetical protein